MEKLTKKILIGTGIAVGTIASLGAMSYLVTKSLVQATLDRNVPKPLKKPMQRLTGFQLAPEIMEQQRLAAEQLQKRPNETVCIVSDDGENLVGHWFPCKGAKRTILAVHGWRSSWITDFALVSDFWFSNHFNVLYIEQRGQNNSGGDYMGFGLTERFDCLAWLDWINHRVGEKLPLYLVGLSMGASTVLMAAGLELPENVCGIMADSGFTSPHAIWKHVIKNHMHLNYGGLRMRVIDDMCRQRIKMGASDYSCVDAMRQCKVPVCFIHGTDDHFVPVEMTYENYKACSAPKYLFIAPGADHGMSYLTDPEGYKRYVRRFWRECDARLA